MFLLINEDTIPYSTWWLNVVAAVSDGHMPNSLWIRKTQSFTAKGQVVTIYRTAFLNKPAKIQHFRIGFILYFAWIMQYCLNYYWWSVSFYLLTQIKK